MSSNRNKIRKSESIIEVLLGFSTFITVLITVGIILVLFINGFHFFAEVSFWDFITDTEWTPTFSEKHYGVLPLLLGTLLTTLIALLVAIPMGITIAIYLSEYAPDKFRRTVKPMLEVLAAVPTVVYGFFALTIVTPALRSIFPSIEANNALSAGLVMGIMILPLVSSLSEDAMKAVPKAMKEASYGLGATKFQTAFKVVLPAASSGIMVSIILAISRAIGETMIVNIAAGVRPTTSFNPLVEVETITSFMADIAKGDVEHGTTAYYSLFATGMVLFLFTFFLNVISQKVKKKFQEKYE